MKMMQRSLLLAAIAAAGCGGYSAPDEVVLGTGVYTQQAPASDFKPLRTYYLDPLMEVWKDGTQEASVAVPDSSSQLIIQRMAAYGYGAAPVALTNPPDVGVRLITFQNTYTAYYSYCSGYWYGYYGCYPGWGYAGSYSTGTVLVMMFDLRGSATTPPPAIGGGLPALWVSALYAVLVGGTASNTTVFNTAINRAFDQSPYLKTSAVP